MLWAEVLAVTALVVLFGAAIAALGLLGLASPPRLLGAVEGVWRTGRGMALAVGIRLMLGVLLLLAAPDTRFPATIAVLGWITLAAAAAVPLVGRSRVQRLVDWWLARPPGVVRGWGGVAALLGAFLVYAAW